MTRAVWNGVVVAEAPRTVVVEGNHYFPPEAVRQEYLVESRSRSLCPWKGMARYYTLQVDGNVNPDAAWYYRRPTFLARRIKNHVAFWRGVRIERHEP
ncbi:MAG: DUF427 domain-containing protein [Acidimicrobiia bacterium]